MNVIRLTAIKDIVDDNYKCGPVPPSPYLNVKSIKKLKLY
jgi:hypothetical protein